MCAVRGRRAGSWRPPDRPEVASAVPAEEKAAARAAIASRTACALSSCGYCILLGGQESS
eukprot:366087-Chlamydomonas_euryale.AAC.3